MLGSHSYNRLSLLVIAFSMAALLSIDSTAQAADRPFNEKPYLAPQQMVIIDGHRRLNVYCSGSGLPVVLLEGGYASDSLVWRYVQPLIAKHTRVCSYDRAGERFSDTGPFPRDLSAMVSDLHALVQALDLPKPFILVGHSMGGMNAVLYAEHYKDELTGVVLLDPGTMDDQRRYAQLPNTTAAAQEVIKGFETLQHCHELALNLLDRTRLLSECQWRDPEYSTELNKVQDQMIENPDFWKTLLSVDLCLRSPGKIYIANTLRFFGPLPGQRSPSPIDESVDESELRASQRYLGSLPLTVVSVAERPDATRPQKTVHAEWLTKHDLHKNLTKLSSKGKLIPMFNTSHNVQLDQPEKTAHIILDMVNEVKSSH